jgi:hypothetical protein
MFSISKFLLRKKSPISPSAYVQNGLIACWDGVENAGTGQHNAVATDWKSIVGVYEFTFRYTSKFPSMVHLEQEGVQHYSAIPPPRVG